jgi:hypothetical protein
MLKKAEKTVFIVILLMLSFTRVTAQLSPGDLSNSHSLLEGISNCTKCHVLGNKITDEKCLSCHTEISERIRLNKGYHSSDEAKGIECIACHSEHNGKDFQLIHLDIKSFDHKSTGYTLSKPHARQDCKVCHNSKNIADQKLKSKKNTYLGLSPECLACHTDYHLRTLSSSCLYCHNPDYFVPASKFNHNSARFKLGGKHIKVDCVKCHKVQVTEGRKFQQFTGIQYSNCASCHKDPHRNQFGQNCRQCHNEESFHIVSGINNFDHNKTDFKLEDKHRNVNCKACHKTNFTDPLKHDRCTDCHADYHNKQFVRNGVTPDCSECHSVKGFSQFSFTIEKHNLSRFPLQGSHTAIPCYECHRKQDKWNFREIGLDCNDCHKDIHDSYIQPKYYPDDNCKTCHNVSGWYEIAFDHSKTDFGLTGAHIGIKCRSCHYKSDSDNIVNQKFAGLSKDCSSCHTDIHFKQFEKNGITDCTECHGTENWKASKFNHNNSDFKLDGKHVNVPCSKCHKPRQEASVFYVNYKLKEFKCESCHL